MTHVLHADRFPRLDPERAAFWQFFNDPHPRFFGNHIGLVLEEVRCDYARFRLPFRPELTQPAGIMHGGAIATLIDTAVVPAIGSAYEEPHALFTISMHVKFLAPVKEEDAVGEAWIEKRGRRIVFCRVEVRTASGTLAATGDLAYRVGPPRGT